MAENANRKTCLFCGGEGPFTREHVLPEWAARLIGVTRVQVAANRLDQPPQSWESVGSFGTTVKQVCGRCNGGWMSELEQLAMPILSRMILPAGPVRLSTDEIVVVASWLWKLSIVHEHQSGVPYFTHEERTALMEGNEPPPYGVLMWIADYVGQRDATLRGGPSTFSSPDGHATTGYAMTMTLRRFAAQVVCVREIPGVDMSLTSPYNFTSSVHQIWPDDEDVCSVATARPAAV